MVRLNYTVGDNNIHISDSYLESKRFFATHIDKIKRLYPSNAVCVNRSTESLSREWATHNALYALHSVQRVYSKAGHGCVVGKPQIDVIFGNRQLALFVV